MGGLVELLAGYSTSLFGPVWGPPVWIFVKTLVLILVITLPLFGWYMRKCRMIPVDRKGRATALKRMAADARDRAAAGRPILIFPEGTRVAPGHRRPYQPGAAALYGALGLPVVPVALNSGLFWGRRSFHKLPGRIVVEFLPPIAPGLDRRIFMGELETTIETAADRLAGATVR